MDADALIDGQNKRDFISDTLFFTIDIFFLFYHFH